MNAIAKILSALVLIFSSLEATAYHSFLNTGEILPEGQVQLTGYIESVFDDYDGINFNVRGSMSFSDELQGDVEVGLGEFDIMLAGYVKWVPIPDYEDQPAIGVRGGLHYIKIDDVSETGVTLAPFVSKSFETSIGPFTPFLALPFGISSRSVKPPLKDDTFFMAKLALGTEWFNPDWDENLRIISEISFEIEDSFNSFNIGASYRF